MKIITTMGFCSAKSKHVGFQFAVKDGNSELGGSYTIQKDSPIVSAEPLVGELTISPKFAGCKCCGNKYVYQCGACKMFICYDGKKHSKLKCPHCGCVSDVPATTSNRMVRSAGVGSPYTAYAGISDIPMAAKDKYGNPQGAVYDLAKDNSMTQYTVVVLWTCWDGDFSLPEQALKRKGFKVIVHKEVPSVSQLESELFKSGTQLWIIDEYLVKFSTENLDLIKRYHDSGYGVYIWADNDPYIQNSNLLFARLFSSRMTISGDYIGDRVLTIQTRAGEPGIIANHPISTGIVNIFEGVTISHLENYSGYLTPLIYSSDKQVVTAFEDRDGKRTIVDGGFTRLFYKWDTAGTDRYVVNAAAWLANIERFGYRA